MALTFTDGATHQAEAFTCTPEHPFYVDGKGYVQAGQLGIGTSIVMRAVPHAVYPAKHRPLRGEIG